MIRKDKKTFKDGTVKTQIRVTEGYRPYPNSSPKQRTVKSFGYLEEQTDLEAFWNEVNACNNSLKKKKDPTGQDAGCGNDVFRPQPSPELRI